MNLPLLSSSGEQLINISLLEFLQFPLILNLFLEPPAIMKYIVLHLIKFFTLFLYLLLMIETLLDKIYC